MPTVEEIVADEITKFEKVAKRLLTTHEMITLRNIFLQFESQVRAHQRERDEVEKKRLWGMISDYAQEYGCYGCGEKQEHDPDCEYLGITLIRQSEPREGKEK